MHHSSSTIRPQALIVEDLPQHADLARQHLESVGFEVSIAHTLIQASHHTYRMLDAQQPYRPTLILVDFGGVQPGRPELEGPNWVAVVVRDIQQHKLHPAAIVAISGDLNPERVKEAYVAGCSNRVLEKPLSNHDALWLRQLVTQVPPIPHADASPQEQAIIQAFQTASARSVQAILARSVNWTPDDVYLVLRHLTPYPPQQVEPADDGHIEQLLARLGGPGRARELLQSIANQMSARVYGEILAMFLNGWERRDIVSHFQQQQLYDRSHIYHCINDLPAKICDRLKVHQLVT